MDSSGNGHAARQGRNPISALIAIAALYLCAAPAQGATTYPQSTGTSGPCVFTAPINTDTGTGIPGFGDTEPATATTPALRIANCTTISIPAGTVPVTGSRALDLRAQGAVQIDGTLDLAASFQTPGPGAGAGGPGGGNPNPSGGQSGSGQGPGFGGSVGGAGGGSGGLPGMAYNNGGSAGTTGQSTATLNFGGGGGGAGSGGGFSVGSGGGGGGSSSTGASDGGFGGGGGGAVRVVTNSSITISGTGAVRTGGGIPGSPTAPTNPSGGAGGGGSGGSQVLIAPTVTVNSGAILDTRGGDGDLPMVPSGGARGGDGANGVITAIANSFSNSGSTNPTPLQANHSDQITVTKAGNGSGTVTSAPAGIDCGSDCTELYDPGATVTLTATPAAGSTFGGWSGACAGQSAVCSLNSGAVRAATAAFTLAPSSQPAQPGQPSQPAARKKCKRKKKRGGRASAAKKCKRKKKRR